MAEVLRVDRLRKAFGSEVVLQDISFTVPEHTATVFIGASGSGKSTLLRCINLLEQIDDGIIILDGEEITAVEIDVDEVRKKFGMVFQAFNLFPHLRQVFVLLCL
jgi:polar amino acid transport system ATP-binding protein